MAPVLTESEDETTGESPQGTRTASTVCVTVARRQTDGFWRISADGGNPRPEP